VIDNQAVATSVEELLGLRLDAHSVMRSSRKRVSQAQVGPSASRSLGRGLDFAESRVYQPGDDVRNMDWNVTARTGQAHTKLFVEEREKPTYLLVDLNPGMWFATRGMFKSMLATRLAVLLAWCAVASNDRVGGIVTAGSWHREIKPLPGRRGVMALIRNLLEAQRISKLSANDSASALPAEVSGATRQSNKNNSPIAESEITGRFLDNVNRLHRLSKGGGEVVVLSDFSAFDSDLNFTGKETKKSAQAASLQALRMRLAALGSHAGLTMVRAYDPLEKDLPAGGRLDVLTRGVRSQLVQGADERLKHVDRFAARTQELARLSAGSGRISMYQVATVEKPVAALQRLLAGR